VICYIDERYWSQAVNSVPEILRQKKINKLDAEFAGAGFPAISSDTGWIQVSTAGRSLQETMGFLADMNIAAVTVEPSDIPNWLGKDVVSLSVKRALESQGRRSIRAGRHRARRAGRCAETSSVRNTEQPTQRQ
jgi:hypothetical protein